MFIHGYKNIFMGIFLKGYFWFLFGHFFERLFLVSWYQ